MPKSGARTRPVVDHDRDPTKGSAKALVKGLLLIDAIAESNKPVRVSTLAEISGLPRQTLARLLDTLLVAHVVSTDDGTEYRLGPALAAWGRRYSEQLDIAEISRAALDALAAMTRETCLLGMLEQEQVFYVAKVDGGQPVQSAATIFSRMPLHSTALGKSILAFGDADVLERVLVRPLEARTTNTITDPAKLRREIQRVRRRGYAIDDVENEEGIRCVAAPILGPGGVAVAAISISAPAYRVDVGSLHGLAPALQEATREVSKKLGFVGAVHEGGDASGAPRSTRTSASRA